MKKRDRKRVEKDERHLGTRILQDIADAMAMGRSTEIRRQLLESAFRADVSIGEIGRATIEGITRPFRERG